MQLSDTEFTAWMDRLVEARRNRQENKPEPYSHSENLSYKEKMRLKRVNDSKD